MNKFKKLLEANYQVQTNFSEDALINFIKAFQDFKLEAGKNIAEVILSEEFDRMTLKKALINAEQQYKNYAEVIKAL